MAICTWVGGNPGNLWNDNGNWSGGFIPSNADDVIFTNIAPGINNPCILSTTQGICRTLTIESGYTNNIALNVNLVVGGIFQPNNQTITINGTPTFTGNGFLQISNNSLVNISSLSSSLNVIIPRLSIAVGFGSNVASGAQILFSGSIKTNLLSIDNAGSVGRWGGANGSQIIVSGSTSQPGKIQGTTAGVYLFPQGNTNPTYIPPLICSGSISWEYGGLFPFSLLIASGCIFNLTGSPNPNTSTYNINGGSLNMAAGGKTAPNHELHVHADATLLCTTASFLQLQGGGTNPTFAVHMSGSTTNKWNGLFLNNAAISMSSDIWLSQNQNLESNPNSSTRLFGIGRMYWSGTNTILNSPGRTIYVGGNLGTVNNQILTSNPNQRFPSGPRLLMYGAGYIGSPSPAATTATVFNINSVDVFISSSKNIAWGTPGEPNLILQNGVSTFAYVTANSWEAYPSNFRIGPGIMDLQGKAVWNMFPGLLTTTHTFSSSIACSGSLIFPGSVTILNSSSLTNPTISVLQNVVSTQSVNAGIPQANIGNVQSGTVPIQMIGNLPATYSLSIFPSPANIKCPDITINKPGGSVLIKNIVSSSAGTPPILWERPLNYSNGTFTYIAGTVNGGTSTMQLGPSASMNTAGNNIPWYNITVSGSGTGTARGSLVNIISPLVISNELNLGAAGNVAFTGSDTWTCSRLVCTTPGRRIILQDAVSNGQKEYRTTNFVNLSSSVASPIFMSSSNTPTTRASWSVSFNAPDANVFNVSGAYIDSSNGRTIFTTGGTSNTINWNLGTQPISSFYTFFIS